MNCGDIFRWVTDKAIGHATRPKIQIFIDEMGWQQEGFLFLMINTRQYGADYPLIAAQYPGILDYDSFVSCSGGPIYDSVAITRLRLRPIGRLTKADCVGLRNAIIATGAMEQWMEAACCDELAKFC